MKMATIKIISLLAACLSAPVVTQAAFIAGVDLFTRNFTIDPPRGTSEARFDLSLDLAGVWQIATPTGQLVDNYIWQECLEMTITGDNAPLHHMIHDGKYITQDVLGPQFGDKGGSDAGWKAIIAQPTALEASYGAQSSSVFYVDNTVPGSEDLAEGETIEIAIRFKGGDGNFYFQQNATHLGAGSAGAGAILVFELSATLACEYPYDPTSEYCRNKTYDDEDPNSFTPACCSEGYCGNTTIYEIGLGSEHMGDCSSQATAACNGDELEADDSESDNFSAAYSIEFGLATFIVLNLYAFCVSALI